MRWEYQIMEHYSTGVAEAPLRMLSNYTTSQCTHRKLVFPPFLSISTALGAVSSSSAKLQQCLSPLPSTAKSSAASEVPALLVC